VGTGYKGGYALTSNRYICRGVVTKRYCPVPEHWNKIVNSAEDALPQSVLLVAGAVPSLPRYTLNVYW
jgi:hypothetical protein